MASLLAASSGSAATSNGDDMGFSKEETAVAKAVFHFVDLNADGLISVNELVGALQTFRGANGQPLPGTDMLMEELADVPGSQLLDFEQVRMVLFRQGAAELLNNVDDSSDESEGSDDEAQDNQENGKDNGASANDVEAGAAAAEDDLSLPPPPIPRSVDSLPDGMRRRGGWKTRNTAGMQQKMADSMIQDNTNRYDYTKHLPGGSRYNNNNNNNKGGQGAGGRYAGSKNASKSANRSSNRYSSRSGRNKSKSNKPSSSSSSKPYHRHNSKNPGHQHKWQRYQKRGAFVPPSSDAPAGSSKVSSSGGGGSSGSGGADYGQELQQAMARSLGANWSLETSLTQSQEETTTLLLDDTGSAFRWLLSFVFVAAAPILVFIYYTRVVSLPKALLASIPGYSGRPISLGRIALAVLLTPCLALSIVIVMMEQAAGNSVYRTEVVYPVVILAILAGVLATYLSSPGRRVTGTLYLLFGNEVAEGMDRTLFREKAALRSVPLVLSETGPSGTPLLRRGNALTVLEGVAAAVGAKCNKHSTRLVTWRVVLTVLAAVHAALPGLLRVAAGAAFLGDASTTNLLSLYVVFVTSLVFLMLIQSGLWLFFEQLVVWNSFTNLTHVYLAPQDDLPYIDLRAHQNLVAWWRVRTYLLKNSKLHFARTEVATIVIILIIVLSALFLVIQLFVLDNSSTFTWIALFLILVNGALVFNVVSMGIRTSLLQQKHYDTLLDRKLSLDTELLSVSRVDGDPNYRPAEEMYAIKNTSKLIDTLTGMMLRGRDAPSILGVPLNPTTLRTLLGVVFSGAVTGFFTFIRESQA